MATGLCYDERFLSHRAWYEHPEHPGRLRAVREHLEREGLAARCTPTPVRPATRDELCAVHAPELVDAIEATARDAPVQIDPDTYACAESAEVARLAAGALVELVAGVLRGDLQNGLALLRPPGHHAESRRSMGFCLYNNVAVAARAALGLGARRVLIVDWDLHHGNGTQEIFWKVPEVLYFSTHQYPYYPGTGAADEVGDGPGVGRTVNVPWPGGMGDAEYLAAFDRVLLPIAERFAPDLVLVSAGFDAAAGDPLGAMELSAAGYSQMTARLARLAGGRVVLALEGGYDLGAISRAAAACTRVLLGEPPLQVPLRRVHPVAERILERVLGIQRAYWEGL